jgi:hypothetical protein
MHPAPALGRLVSAARFPLVAASDLQRTIRTTIYLATIASPTDNDLSATTAAKKWPAGKARFAAGCACVVLWWHGHQPKETQILPGSGVRHSINPRRRLWLGGDATIGSMFWKMNGFGKKLWSTAGAVKFRGNFLTRRRIDADSGSHRQPLIQEWKTNHAAPSRAKSQ